MTSNTYLTQNQALHIYQTHSQTWYKISGGNARAAQRGSHHASSRSEKRIGEQGELLCLRSRAYGLLVCKLTARSDAPLSIGLTSYQPSAARTQEASAGSRRGASSEGYPEAIGMRRAVYIAGRYINTAQKRTGQNFRLVFELAHQPRRRSIMILRGS